MLYVDYILVNIWNVNTMWFNYQIA